jgi:uncharacterized protein (TIGR02145 family)
LPGGSISYSNFSSLGEAGYWWSSSLEKDEHHGDSQEPMPSALNISRYGDYVSLDLVNSQDVGYSIRCINSNGQAVVTTDSISTISTTSATISGTLVYRGTDALQTIGVQWGTDSLPSSWNPESVLTHNDISNIERDFHITITELQLNTQYYARVYATNANGTRYGKVIPLHTMPIEALVPNGDGTEGSPYEIESLNNLLWITLNSQVWESGNYFRQTADIDATSTSSWYNGKGWIPIAYGSTTEFNGVYDGNEKIIDGLHINRDSDNKQGLFGYVYNATVASLGLINVSISGNFDVGAIAGNANGIKINQCFSTGSINGKDNVGGLIGNSYYSKVSNSYSVASVSGNFHVGGIAGQLGYNDTLEYTYAAGRVIAPEGVAGGIAGYAYETENVYSYWDILSSGQSSSPIGEALTTGQMLDSMSFTGWTLYPVWGIDQLVSYPYLRWESGPNDHNLPSGTEAKPHQIATLNDLKWLSETPDLWDKHFIQTANIDALETEYWNDNEGFSPIGTDAGNPFYGSYQGQGHVITNLHINRPTMDNVGLFGHTSAASITNLGLVDAEIIGNNNVGGLVGLMTEGSTIDTCFAIAAINCNSYGGGLIGYATSSFIYNSYAGGSVHGSSVGGLVSYISESGVFYCYSTAQVTGLESTGGGLVYIGNASDVVNSYWDTQTSTLGTSPGGGQGLTTAQMLSQTNYEGWNFEDIWGIVEEESYPYHLWQGVPSPHNYPIGTAQNPYRVNNLADLVWLSEYPALWDKHFIQTNNIDASETTMGMNSGEGLFTIGNSSFNFTGTYNGDGYSIEGLYINRPSQPNQALFGYASGARISNLTLTNVSISGSASVGGLIGYANVDTYVDSCSTSGSISAQGNSAGGLIGHAYNAFISYCYSTASVSANESVGGLVGLSTSFSDIQNCYSNGIVSGNFAGGLVGSRTYYAKISNSYSTGIVNGTTSIGGLVGYEADVSPIENSFWDTETSSLEVSAGGTGLTTFEMTQMASFTGWDFTNIWAINVGETYPYLQWQKENIQHNNAHFVVDIDENVYRTVTIGELEWMAENLRVTKYNSGLSIPTGLNDTQWQNTSEGAYAVYPYSSAGLASEEEVLQTYGALYNWYAVDSYPICPVGWRVPNSLDWQYLYINVRNEYDGTEGYALKSSFGWSNDGNGIDAYGFNALPGGYKATYGTFFNVTDEGTWWSIDFSGSDALIRRLEYNSDTIESLWSPKNTGYSIRCVRGDSPL